MACFSVGGCHFFLSGGNRCRSVGIVLSKCMREVVEYIFNHLRNGCSTIISLRLTPQKDWLAGWLAIGFICLFPSFSG